MVIKTGADLIGVDAAPGLLEIARQRNPLNHFMEEDLESLPFGDESFDVVTGFNSFQYAGSFKNALTEAKRVLKPEGRLVLCIWDKPEASDATNVLKSIGSLLPPPPPGTPGPFALSEDGKIEGILDEVGFHLLNKFKVICPFLYSSLSNGIRSFMGTGPAAAALNTNSRQIVEQTISDALATYNVADDFHYLQNQFLVFIAEK
jgi:ubiquinone/menaquinone biosynthesis C-methylase UbiE